MRHAGIEPGSEVLLRAIDEPGGWGLVLLDQLADRWGVVNNGGTRVWLEIDRATAGAG